MKHYRVLKVFPDGKGGEHAVGAVIELADDVAKGLIMGGCIAEVVMDQSAIDFRKELTGKLSKVAEEAAAAATKRTMEEMRASVQGVHIEVGASPEEKLLKTGGFKSFGHFCYDVYKAGQDGRGASETLKRYSDAVTKAPQGLNEGVEAEGGYLIPVQQAAVLLEKEMEAAIVRPRATTMPLASSSLKVPAIKDDDRSSNLFGGVVVYRKPEAAQLTKSQPKFKKVTLELTKLTGFCFVTDEMMSDSPISIDPLLNRLFPAAMAFTEDGEFLTATGVGEPLGALAAGNGSRLTINKEVGQAADTLVVENILKMYARCYGKNKAVWIANHDCFVQLATMALKVGTGGTPVWLPGNSVAGTPNGTLLGLPMILSEQVPTVGDLGDISLCDFSQYLIAERAGEGLQAATSIHLRFDYNETAFRFTMRSDGQPWWSSTFQPKNGATMSPFVVLEAR